MEIDRCCSGPGLVTSIFERHGGTGGQSANERQEDEVCTSSAGIGISRNESTEREREEGVLATELDKLFDEFWRCDW